MEARGVRRTRAEEEQESYFISMSDMMVGLLFIFIILLLYFALQFRQTTETLTGAGETRREILETLKRRLDERLRPYDLTVRIDPVTGVLSLPNSVLFETAQYELTPQGRAAIGIVAEELAIVLPCYADVARGGPPCLGQEAEHKIDAILVEGHTDANPLIGSGTLRDNFDLSALRATHTFRQLLTVRRGLRALENRSGRRPVPILGVAGYGEFRPDPQAHGSPEEVNAWNRRIDLRFLMVTPAAEAQAVGPHLGGLP